MFFHFVGHYEAEKHKGTSHVSERIDGLTEQEPTCHHSDRGLKIHVVVGSKGTDDLHGFIPEQIGHRGAHDRKEKKVEEVGWLGEIKKDLEMEGFVLNKEQREGSDEAVEEEFTGEEESAVDRDEPLDGDGIDCPRHGARNGENVANRMNLHAEALAYRFAHDHERDP